jgi:hypothetical protein
LTLLAPLVEAGDAQAAELLLQFFAGWLHDHTILTDRMMAAFVRNHERIHAAAAVDRAASGFTSSFAGSIRSPACRD